MSFGNAKGKKTIFVTPDSEEAFFFVDNHVFVVPYSQQYINALHKTLGKSTFSCGQIYFEI